MFTTSETEDLAEWIIDDTCLVLVTYVKRQKFVYLWRNFKIPSIIIVWNCKRMRKSFHKKIVLFPYFPLLPEL